MDKQTIRQDVADFVPEFDGTQNPSRFFGTADKIYAGLETNEQKELFYRLISFKLTGEAFTRINHRQITDYPTLRKILENMYAPTYTLDELERNFTNIHQSYGETIRNYGYRLAEAMEKYKEGYRVKYQLKNTDETYNTHLNMVSVQVFKRGLNNTILKEKVATHKAKNIDEIIDETEVIEKMLEITTHTLPDSLPKQSHIQNSRNSIKHRAIICNYCNKANHTWNVCRSRLIDEAAKQRNVFHHQNRYKHPGPKMPEFRHQLPQTAYQNFTKDSYETKYVPQFNNNHEQRVKSNTYAPKYCSHCKTTTGHTFDECRSKFFAKGPKYNTTHYNPKPQQNSENINLEEQFKNMHINTVFPERNYNTDITQFQNQGNSTGSNQQ